MACLVKLPVTKQALRLQISKPGRRRRFLDWSAEKFTTESAFARAGGVDRCAQRWASFATR